MTTTGYQVWSSVLGTSLTSVNTSGEKVETKVFAGGTHIATQHEMNPATTSDDSLTFITADPVTGSVARYSGSGASADIEESEPLGQMIETSDPGTGYPTSYEDVRGIARDPEWQCLAAGLKRSTFNEMPVHCKKAKLAERDFYLPGALAESDPKRAAMPADGHGSPGRGTPPTLKTGQRLAPEHLTQMRALAATGKFDNEEEIPDCGLTDCVVNVNANDNSIPGFVGAETSGGESDNLSNFDEAVKAVRDILLANNGKNSCAELFRGRGEEALSQISNSVTSAGNAAFRPLADAGVGIHMSFTGRFSPAEALNIEIVRNVDGEYEAVGLITNPVVTINTLGSFVRAFPVSNMEAHRLPRFGGYRAGTLQSRVVQLLHEIGHLIFVGTIPTNVVVGVNGKKMTYRKVVLLFPADDFRPGLSETNTDRVIDECGRLIDALD